MLRAGAAMWCQVRGRARGSGLARFGAGKVTCRVGVAESARKHGIADDDMHHAIRWSLRTVRQPANGYPEDRILFIGPSRTGDLLEVVAIDDDDLDDDPCVIHAMPLREKFFST